MTTLKARMYETNAGDLYIESYATMTTFDVTGVELEHPTGLEDIIAAAIGDTADWAAPSSPTDIEEFAHESNHLIASVDDTNAVTIYPDAMGSAGRLYFGLGRTR